MRKLLKYLKPYWLYVILAPLLMIVEVGSELLMPKIMSYIVDIGVANHDFSYIISRGILMIIIAYYSFLRYCRWCRVYNLLIKGIYGLWYRYKKRYA